MSEPKRIQLRRMKGWHKPGGVIVVSRPSRWGNPFYVQYPLDAQGAMQAYRDLVLTREAWIVEPDGTRHRFTARNAIHVGHANYRDAPSVEQIREIRGFDLACWCRLDQPCHADVLLQIANEVSS